MSASAKPAVPFTAAIRDQSVVAVTLNRPLVGYLQSLAKQLTGGDFEALVIWGEVAHLNIAQWVDGSSDPSTILSCLGRVADEPQGVRPAHLHELTAATGIPRETVRRKLERLASLGCLRRLEAGWAICPERLPRSEPAP